MHYEDGALSGRVMAIALHPFLIGSKYFVGNYVHVATCRSLRFASAQTCEGTFGAAGAGLIPGLIPLPL